MLKMSTKTLAEIVRDLQVLYESDQLPSSHLREIVYQATGVLMEVEQKLGGGFFSKSYIFEKTETINFHARQIK